MKALASRRWAQIVPGVDQQAGRGELVRLIVFSAAYFLAYSFGMSFSRTVASPFWFPDSVLLCALLLTAPRRWWIVLLAALAIRLGSPVSRGIPMWFLLATFAIDVFKGILSAGVLRKILRNPLRIESTRELMLYGFYAILAVPALAACAGAAARQALGDDFGVAWEQWFTGNAVTHLVVTPAILYWAIGAPGLPSVHPRKAWREAVLVFVGLVASCYFGVATGTGPDGPPDVRLFAPVPFLFWAAIRFGMAGATGAVSVLTIFTVGATLRGMGPFSGLPQPAVNHALQQFLSLRAISLYAVAILVHQRRRAELELGESEARFRSLADSAPVLIWSTDTEGCLSFVNRAWLDFTGEQERTALRESWLLRVHPDERERCRELFAHCFSERSRFTLECRLAHAADGYRWVISSGAARFSTGGEFLGYVGSCVDITAQHEDHRAMERLRGELAHVTRVATVGQLTGSISHELRQPLSAIQMNAAAATLLLERDSPEVAEVREILADIRADNLRASEILGKMRQLLEKRDLVRQPVDVNRLVSDTCRLMKFEAAERSISLQTELAGDLSEIGGDRVHLHQVLMNLILNGFDAVKSKPECDRRVVVRTEASGNGGVRLSVLDTGPGIAVEQLPRLFEPFWTTKPGGMGVGLSITRVIVEAHDGRVWGENRPDGGACFQIELPGT